MNALITAEAFLAVADGPVQAIERQEAAHYINPQRVAPTISVVRITELFDDPRATFQGWRLLGFDCNIRGVWNCRVASRQRRDIHPS